MKIRGKRIIAVAVALAMAAQPVMVMAEETETTAVQYEENADVTAESQSGDVADYEASNSATTATTENVTNNSATTDGATETATDSATTVATESMDDTATDEDFTTEADSATTATSDSELTDLESEELEDEGYQWEWNNGTRTAEINVCVGEPILLDTQFVSDKSSYSKKCEFENENEDICEADLRVTDDGYVYFYINGLKKGTATINFNCSKDGEYGEYKEQYVYKINVNEKAADSVYIEDISVRSRLLTATRYDTNEDGNLSKTEMEEAGKDLSALDLSANGIYQGVNSVKSLKGLEYATSLQRVFLNGNSELSDITPLRNMDINLNSELMLEGTLVPEDDIWDIIKDSIVDYQTCDKGDKVVFGMGTDSDFWSNVKIETISGDDNLLKYCDGNDFLALEHGEARLKLVYGDMSVETGITIYGIDADQPLGEECNITVKTFESKNRDFNISSENGNYSASNGVIYKILDSNNMLWSLQSTYTQDEPEQDVEDYVANWIYWGSYNDAAYVRYTLKTDGTLWNNYNSFWKTDSLVPHKIADDVVKFDGRYALNSKGVLHNVYNTDDTDVTQVADWISPDRNSSAVYVLKTDGTLLTRDEVKSGTTVNEFTQLDSDVKQILENFYLKNDGTFRYYDGSTSRITFDGDSTGGAVNENWFYNGATGELEHYDGSPINMSFTISEIVDYGDSLGDYGAALGYYDADGNLYIYSTSRLAYVKVGKIRAKEAYWYSGDIYYFWSTDGAVYKFDINDIKLEKVFDEVEDINEKPICSVTYKDIAGLWAFKLKDGTYYAADCTKIEGDVVLDTYNSIDNIVLHKDGTTSYEINGVRILDDVIQFVNIGVGDLYLLRTDGTLWTDDAIGPVKIRDLAHPFTTLGDINDDDDINISDLMLVLNHVCGKSTLTGNALTAGDVNGDGKVDLQDLMKILNFVSGKSKEL